MGRCLNTFYKIFLIAIVVVSTSTPISSTSMENDTERHLSNFSKFTVSQHDNIDDPAISMHTHIHKHSQDGEEHEHDHQHSKSYQENPNTMYASSIVEIKFSQNQSIAGSRQSNLVSDPHSYSVYRPPIV